jgi:hypothetical protein
MLRSNQKVSRFSLLTKITAFPTLGYRMADACQGTYRIGRDSIYLTPKRFPANQISQILQKRVLLQAMTTNAARKVRVSEYELASTAKVIENSAIATLTPAFT